MQKRLIRREAADPSVPEADWLSVADIESVEISSEDPAYPIESALDPSAGTGWRAADPGPQKVRLRFTRPRRLRRITLHFAAPGEERTQEYVLRWSSDGASYRDVVRQQWNFSVAATHESEDHHVDLTDVTAVELEVTPDVAGGSARASLARLRLA